MSHWIFLRGLMREARHWGSFPATFRQALPDASVHLLDLPGNGRLYAINSPNRIEDMVENCRSQLQARGVAPPYHLLALSLGAMVATAWAARHPDEICRAVLINTSLRPFSPFYHRLRPRNYLEMIGAALKARDALRQESLILRLTSNLNQYQSGIPAEWVAYQHEFPVTRRNTLRQLVAAVRYRAPDMAPSCPLLLLSSRQDRLVDSRCSERLAQVWKAPLLTHQTAGHDLTLDDGDWVAGQVKKWLNDPIPQFHH